MKRAETLLGALLIVALLAATPLPANQGQTPTIDLYQAASRGDLEQVNLHIARGADLNKPNAQGWTPLAFAVDSHRTEVVKRLLEAGANVNTPSRLGPPLVRAAAQGYLDIIELLLANRADPNVRDSGGRSALLAAAEKRDKEMVELLVANGADVNTKDNAGRTPLSLTLRDQEISAYLRQHGAEEPVDPYALRDPYMQNALPGGPAEPRPSFRYQSNTVEPTVLSDPNGIRERIAAFPGLGDVLQAIDTNALSEERSWAQRRTDNRSALIRAVAKQFTEELTFVKGVAAGENAQKTVTAIDQLLEGRAARYEHIGSELRAERRLLQQEARQMTGRGRGRSTARSARGRMARTAPGDAYGDSGMLGDPYGAPAPRGARPGPAGEDVEEEPLDPETLSQLNAWLGADPLDKRSLLSAVHDLDLVELGALRQVALEEEIPKPQRTLKTVTNAPVKPEALEEAPVEAGAKKTVAAIEGLMLARQGRLDRITAKMAEEDARLQRMADRYGTTPMPMRGRRGRGMMQPQPQQQQPTQRRGRR